MARKPFTFEPPVTSTLPSGNNVAVVERARRRDCRFRPNAARRVIEFSARERGTLGVEITASHQHLAVGQQRRRVDNSGLWRVCQ